MILPHKLATTNDQLTSRAGLLAIGQLMDSIQLVECVDKHFPKPKSNRGFMPSLHSNLGAHAAPRAFPFN